MTIKEILDLKSEPIAIIFTDNIPNGVTRVPSKEMAGCGYWRAASEGQVFYTEAEDHYNCPVGSHTHGVVLPPEKAQELEGLIGTMVGLEYLKMEEVPAIPHRKKPFKFAVYAPLSKTPCEPDVVLIKGTARQLMILTEASQAAGVMGEQPAMGRPTCAVLPQAIESGKATASFGCIGNRVYTGAGDDEAYYAVPHAALAAVTEKLAILARANVELEKFHRSRLSV